MTMKRYIKASFRNLKNCVKITDYVGDVVNFLINKPDNYRITYIPSDIYDSDVTDGDVYLIADSTYFIHGYMLESALYDGWLPYLDENMKKYRDSTYDVDEKTVNLLFVPNNVDVYYEDEYTERGEIILTTGRLFTKDGAKKLKQSAP
jgi:hypothetical protein